jgi:hypothetical protein
MEAMKQREIAEAEHQRAMAQKLAAENRVARTDDRFYAIQQKLELAQQQLDATRRTWDEAVARTEGRLTREDRDRINRGFDMLQERFKDLDEVFR